SLLGGRPSVGLGIGAGRSHSRIDVHYALPGGFSTSGSESDARWGRADLYPTANIKWNEGAHNYMVYTSGVLPTGSYRQSRLANVGENRRGLDFGAGYTYFNASRRMEFSLVGGVTHY
ncbi:MAG: transporter, partial [Comamonas sp.]